MMRSLPRLITKARPWLPCWRGGGTLYVDGKPVNRNPTRFFARGLVVPVSGIKVQEVPEGDRLTAAYSIFQDPSQSIDANTRNTTPTPLRVQDKVQLFEDAYIVIQAKCWGSYIEAMAMKIDVGGSTPVDFPALPPDMA